VGVVSQFMQNPCIDHLNAIIYILRYLKKTLGQGLLNKYKKYTQIYGYCAVDSTRSTMDRHSTRSYYVLIGGNIISWKSKKQNVVAKSSAQVEYRVMMSPTCELVWVKQFLQELKICEIQFYQVFP